MAAAILPVAKIAGGLLLGKAVSKGVSKLIGGGKKKSEPVPSAEPEPQVMPIADDEAIRQARKRSIARQLGRSGRSSTILTDDSDTLGGG